MARPTLLSAPGVFLARQRQTAAIALRHVATWGLVLAFGAALLHGRYLFSSAASTYTHKSYSSSLFFFTLTVPTSYYLLRLSPLRKTVVYGLTASLFFLLSLPYQWLGLARWHYVVTVHPWDESGTPEPTVAFLPKTFPVESFPHEHAFFLILFATAAVGAILLAAHATERRVKRAVAARRLAPWLFAYGVILVEAWLHTGLRSGFTLNAFYAEKALAKSWYVSYLFPGQLGAVSSDFHFFFSIEKYFQGMLEPVETFVLRRAYGEYIISQFSYFANSFVVYLTFNTLLWMAAAACMRSFLLRVTRRPALAAFGAALVCVGNGFSYCVSEPTPHLASYANAIIAVEAFDALQSSPSTLDSRKWPWMRALLCGVILGLIGCTYDAQPIVVGLLALMLFRRYNIGRAVLSLGIGLGIPTAFAKLEFKTLGLVLDRGNQSIADDTMANITTLFRHPARGKIYFLVVRTVTVIAQNLMFAFMVAALCLFVIGFAFARHTRERRMLVALLMPVLLLDTLLVWGQVDWAGTAFAEFPRLSYIAYPAIYAGAALALEKLSGDNPGRRMAAWATIALIGIWQNLDAFGVLSPTVHFYFPRPYPWLEPL